MHHDTFSSFLERVFEAPDLLLVQRFNEDYAAYQKSLSSCALGTTAAASAQLATATTSSGSVPRHGYGEYASTATTAAVSTTRATTTASWRACHALTQSRYHTTSDARRDEDASDVMLTLYATFAAKGYLAYCGYSNILRSGGSNSSSSGGSARRYMDTIHVDGDVQLRPAMPRADNNKTTTARAATATQLRGVCVRAECSLRGRVTSLAFVLPSERAYVVACRRSPHGYLMRTQPAPLSLLQQQQQQQQQQHMQVYNAHTRTAATYYNVHGSSNNSNSNSNNRTSSIAATAVTPATSSSLVGVLAAHIAPIMCLAVSHDYTLIASCSYSEYNDNVRHHNNNNGSSDSGAVVVVCEATSMRSIATLVHPVVVLCVAFTADDAHVVTGGGDGSCRVWHTRACAQASPAAVYRAHACAITHLAAYPLSSNSNNNNKSKSGNSSSDSDMDDAVYSSWVASASCNGVVRVWAARTLRRRYKLSHASLHHDCALLALHFSSDGAWLLSASVFALVLSDAASGVTLLTTTPQTLRGVCYAASPYRHHHRYRNNNNGSVVGAAACDDGEDDGDDDRSSSDDDDDDSGDGDALRSLLMRSGGRSRRVCDTSSRGAVVSANDAVHVHDSGDDEHDEDTQDDDEDDDNNNNNDDNDNMDGDEGDDKNSSSNSSSNDDDDNDDEGSGSDSGAARAGDDAAHDAVDDSRGNSDGVYFTAALFAPSCAACIRHGVVLCLSDGTVALARVRVRGDNSGGGGNTPTTAAHVTTQRNSSSNSSNDNNNNNELSNSVLDLSPALWSTRLRAAACCACAGPSASVLVGDAVGNVTSLSLLSNSSSGSGGVSARRV